jgi:hypothetical protein
MSVYLARKGEGMTTRFIWFLLLFIAIFSSARADAKLPPLAVAEFTDAPTTEAVVDAYQRSQLAIELLKAVELGLFIGQKAQVRGFLAANEQQILLGCSKVTPESCLAEAATEHMMDWGQKSGHIQRLQWLQTAEIGSAELRLLAETPSERAKLAKVSRKVRDALSSLTDAIRPHSRRIPVFSDLAIEKLTPFITVLQ